MELVAEQVDEVVRLVDTELGTWVLEVIPLDYDPAPQSQVPSGMCAEVLRAIADQFPQLSTLQRHVESGDAIRVTFSPGVMEGLRNGSLKLMQSGAVSKAVAVTATGGEIVELGAVAGTSAVAAGGVALAAPAAPVILAAVIASGVAVAAAAAHQHWLKNTFAGLEAGLKKLTVRLRDDDHGDLDAADQLIDVIGGSALGEVLPPLLIAEVAEARRKVEAIYFSRRRFAARFKEELEQRQVKAGESKDGTPKTWTTDIARDLVDEDKGVIDELALFFRAMIARARLGAIAASILIADGAYGPALRVLDQTKATTRADYFDLHNRLAALARFAPEPSILEKVPLLNSHGRGMSAHEKVSALAGGADSAIGERILDEEPLLELIVGSTKRRSM